MERLHRLMHSPGFLAVLSQNGFVGMDYETLSNLEVSEPVPVSACLCVCVCLNLSVSVGLHQKKIHQNASATLVFYFCAQDVRQPANPAFVSSLPVTEYKAARPTATSFEDSGGKGEGGEGQGDASSAPPSSGNQNV